MFNPSTFLPSLLHLLPHQHTKSHYLAPIITLRLLSLPAGLISFIALFLLPPPCETFTARIQALLILSIFLFFSATLVSVFLHMLLAPLYKEQLVEGKRNGLLLLGLGTAWTETLGGLVVLGLTVGAFAGEIEGAKGVGVIGIATMGVLVVGVLGLGVGTVLEDGGDAKKEKKKQSERERKEWEERQPKSPMPLGTSTTSTTATSKPKPAKDFSKTTALFIFFILITQFLLLVALLGITTSAAIKAEVWGGCNGIQEEGLIVIEGGGDGKVRGSGARTRTVVDTSTIFTSRGSTVTVLSTGSGSMGSPRGAGMGNGNSTVDGEDGQATITETEVLRTTTTIEVDPSSTTF